MKTSLFIFRRDLRLEDNLGLLQALESSQKVIPCFFLDPRQLESPYKSDFAIHFMFESLLDLHRALIKRGSKLYLFQGIVENCLEKLIESHQVDAVFLNQDYTPFSRQRDDKIKKICQQKQIQFVSVHDALLTQPGSVLTNEGEPYSIYSFFAKKAKLQAVAKPKKNDFKNFHQGSIKGAEDTDELLSKRLPSFKSYFKGGREEPLAVLKRIQNFENYEEERNYPALERTTKLSPHHKFGTLSIRETYWSVVHKFGLNHTLISELYWRDFFTHILYFFPHVLGHAFHKKFDKLSWENNPKKFEAWCQGQTGFPIVDAGMRQLNETGWMHNRVRMIVASFLIKDLHIDWRWGEKYFAQKLVDYDPAVNNGSWQWAASTGCDAQPYFRIFNPWSQQKKFDPEVQYIKKWIPELKDESKASIHEWSGGFSYPEPIINHSIEVKKTKELYSKV